MSDTIYRQDVQRMALHELKILPEYFDAVVRREKTFEIRKNDRGFKAGDRLRLMEWDGEEYTGREAVAYVSYILYDWPVGIERGYCVMSISIEPEHMSRKWIRVTKDLAQCPECGDYVDNAIQRGCNYCPNCGAEMET